MKLSGAESFSRHEAGGKIKYVGETDFLVCAKFKEDLLASEYNLDHDSVTVHFPECTGWIRVGKKLPILAEFKDRRLRISVAVSSPAEPVKINSIAIMQLSTSGTLTIARKIAASITASEKKHTYSFTLQQGITRELAELGADHNLFLFLEISKPCILPSLVLSWTAIEPPPYDVPYVTSSHPLSRRLVDNNSRVATAGKVGANDYFLDQCELSVRLDCIETAHNLLHKIDASELSSDELFEKWLWTTTEILIARGETDLLKDFLLSHHKHTMKDDHLFTALSICFPADALHARTFAKLPSGKFNRNFISRLGDGQHGLSTLLDADRKHLGASEFLLLASDVRKHSLSLYERMWSHYFNTFDMKPFRFMEGKSVSNILSNLSFPNLHPSLGGPKISIIMSAYNSETTITYAMNSILDQTHQNLELLVCDDQSTDETAERMLNFKGHPRVRLFRSNSNQGPYNIRSGLIREATGDYVTFQDADDFAHPERLSRQIKALSQGKRFAMGKWVRIRPDGEVVFFRDQLCLRMCVVSLMLPRDMFTDFSAYRQVLCGGDSELYENVKTAFGSEAVANIDAPLILGLWSDGSLTRSGGIEATEDGYRSLARRAYAEATSRQRLLGRDIVRDEDIDTINKGNGIYRENRGISPL